MSMFYCFDSMSSTQVNRNEYLLQQHLALQSPSPMASNALESMIVVERHVRRSYPIFANT